MHRVGGGRVRHQTEGFAAVPEEKTFVIAGASLAGVSAAEELRKQGFEGRIVLIGAEQHHPYIRPPLSKDYLAGKAGLDDVYVHPLDWYDEAGFDLKLGTSVTAIDRVAHIIELSDGESVGYDKLLIATGSTPRVLDVPGAELDGVYYLRTKEDSEALRDALSDGGKRVIVIGSGWIGMEIAATAKTLGNDVHVLLNKGVPLAKPVGEELGTFFEDAQIEKGVVFTPSVKVDEITTETEVLTVHVVSGEAFEADVVVAAIGAAPNVGLAEAAGLDVEDGILVDASLTTSDPDILAAGDVARAMHPVINQRMRSEHWANALNEGAAAARSMLGQSVSYDEIPYAYTDQFDIGMEFSGYMPLIADASLVYRGSKESKEFIVFWVLDGKVVAGMNVNVWDVNEAVQGIIRRANTVDVDALANPDVALDTL
jgi:NADPH-dependent 2,4-dienoyl-CoA reductase/sulfur reductase-like enzyme